MGEGLGTLRAKNQSGVQVLAVRGDISISDIDNRAWIMITAVLLSPRGGIPSHIFRQGYTGPFELATGSQPCTFSENSDIKSYEQVWILKGGDRGNARSPATVFPPLRSGFFYRIFHMHCRKKKVAFQWPEKPGHRE